MVLGKTLESPLNCKEIQPVVNPKGNQSWIFIGRTDAKVPILWPPDNWLIGKDPDAGKDWRQEKGMTEDEMVGRHHWLNGHEFEQALGVGDGQGGPVCCQPRGHKESHTTEWMKWTDLKLLKAEYQNATQIYRPQVKLSNLYFNLSPPDNSHVQSSLKIRALLKLDIPPTKQKVELLWKLKARKLRDCLKAWLEEDWCERKLKPNQRH